MKLVDSLKTAIGAAGDLEVDLVALQAVRGLTRYANSEVHQNVVESERSVTARVARGKSVGVASTNALDPASLRRAIDNAAEIARNVPENPDFSGMPAPGKVATLKMHDPKTAALTPTSRVSAISKVFKAADRDGFAVAGAYESSDGEIAVVSSAGVAVGASYTSVSANVVVLGESEGASGFASGCARRSDGVNVPALGDIAINKCRWSKNPREIPPGEYDVILEPPALSEALEWLSYIGMTSRSMEEGTSFLTDRIGQQVADPSFSVYDDPFDREGVAFPFDFEGIPKTRVPIIENGVARGVVHSSHSAIKAGVENTGNAVPGDTGSQGGFPLNISVPKGTIPRERMLEHLGTGLLITRFHYVNGLIDTRNAVLTGMTRDGTFWVENGLVKYPVKNLRFTQPMLEAFSRVDGISRERYTFPSWWSDAGAIVSPSVIVRRFSFTGASDH
jgi:PmbA protein